MILMSQLWVNTLPISLLSMQGNLTSNEVGHRNNETATKAATIQQLQYVCTCMYEKKRMHNNKEKKRKEKRDKMYNKNETS